jgi:hypothetical protein
MATTGVSAVGDQIAAEIVESRVVKELRPAMTSRVFLRKAVGGFSTVVSFPLWGDPGAAAAPADDLSEIASTVLSDTETSVTAAGIGFRVDITDLSKAVTPSDLYSEAGRMVGAALSEKWETDLAALMDDFSNVTTAASTLSGVDVLAAVSALEQRDVPGPFYGYFDPKQTGELRVEIATTTAQYQSGGRDADKVKPFGVDGYWGEYLGLPIFQTSLVVTTTGLIGGAVFNGEDALGYYEIIGAHVETQRDASYKAMEFVGYHVYGLKEISDTRGQTVKSAA